MEVLDAVIGLEILLLPLIILLDAELEEKN
jgi:hypothetical protein